MSSTAKSQEPLGLLEALFNLAPDPVWVVDRGGALTKCNKAFARWWPNVAADAKEAVTVACRRVAAGRSVMIDVTAIIDGVERTYVVHAGAVKDEAAIEGTIFVAREIGQFSATPNELAIELALTNLFARDTADPLGETLAYLSTSEGWDAGSIWLANGNVLEPAALWFGTDELREHLAPRIANLRFEYGHGVPGRAWASGEVIWIPDILDESVLQRAELVAAAGLHSAVAAPLVDSGRGIGAIEFFTRAVRPISERTQRSLVRTGNALGRLIERRRAELERRNLVELVERKGAEWMQTVDAIAMPILLVESDGTIARLNTAARDFAKLSFDQLIGKHIRELSSEEPWTTLADTVDAVRDSGMACTAQITAGAAVWDVSASPLDQRVVLVVRDLTDLIALQESVRRGEQLAALGELVAGVAHEVKNPIFGMGMTLDLLDRSVNEDARELMGVMRTWLDRLSSLTENLLEYGRTWSIELKPGNPGDVLRQSIRNLEPRAATANVTIDCSDPIDAQILMDERRLIHVFENLIGNAIQFSPAGHAITIAAEIGEEGIDYFFRDDGPGFRPEDLPRIFQPFYTKRRGGTGLGLSIVQRIVDEHGGSVTASNRASGGAQLHVHLPSYSPGV